MLHVKQDFIKRSWLVPQLNNRDRHQVRQLITDPNSRESKRQNPPLKLTKITAPVQEGISLFLLIILLISLLFYTKHSWEQRHGNRIKQLTFLSPLGASFEYC